MTISLGNLLIVCFAFLGLWKLHDLLFPKKEKPENKRPISWEVQAMLLNTFLAEFTYKTMENNEEYKAAPKETYTMLQEEFSRWLKAKADEIKKK